MWSWTMARMPKVQWHYIGKSITKTQKNQKNNINQLNNNNSTSAYNQGSKNGNCTKINSFQKLTLLKNNRKIKNKEYYRQIRSKNKDRRINSNTMNNYWWARKWKKGPWVSLVLDLSKHWLINYGHSPVRKLTNRAMYWNCQAICPMSVKRIFSEFWERKNLSRS